jgi:hypothetical protein
LSPKGHPHSKAIACDGKLNGRRRSQRKRNLAARSPQAPQSAMRDKSATPRAYRHNRMISSFQYLEITITQITGNEDG